jgi:hypothetical protein
MYITKCCAKILKHTSNECQLSQINKQLLINNLIKLANFNLLNKNVQNFRFVTLASNKLFKIKI